MKWQHGGVEREIQISILVLICIQGWGQLTSIPSLSFLAYEMEIWTGPCVEAVMRKEGADASSDSFEPILMQ